ncbi:MAG: dipeptide epimerase [Bacillota bacterium]
MKIIGYKLYYREIPLANPFKTALRTVNTAKELVFELQTDSVIGFGAAPPTEVITGDNIPGIASTLRDQIWPKLKDQNCLDLNYLLQNIQGAAVHNTSAKAAAEIALYDLNSKIQDLPLYRYLGGRKKDLITDLTISVDTPRVMAAAATKAVEAGFQTLKLKVGVGPEVDLARVKAVREAVGQGVALRLDANQGWTTYEAIQTIEAFAEAGLNIELVEQPVAARDFKGLKQVKDNVEIPIMADESLFSLQDGLKLLEMQACDYLNIKLMKTGGISTALEIASLARNYGVECMLGSMLESRISVSAAAAVASASENITRLDLDAPFLIGEDGVSGGIHYQINKLFNADAAGLGITKINGLKEIKNIWE